MLCTSSTPKYIILRSNLPKGWLVVDLLYYGYMLSDETVLLKNGTYSDHFLLDNHQLLLQKPLTDIQEYKIKLQFVVDRGRFQRPFSIDTKLDHQNIYGFNTDIYEAYLNSSAKVGTQIQFQLPLALNYEKLKSNDINISEKSIRYSIITSTNDLGLNLINRPKYSELYLTAAVPVSVRPLQQFYIGAYDIETQQLLATARCLIWIQFNDTDPPKFTAKTYSVTLDSTVPYSNILRVTAKSTSGVVTYQIEPEVSEFDISPFSGDIFSQKHILPGNYAFNVTAKSSNGQKSKVPVKVFVVKNTSIAMSPNPWLRSNSIQSRASKLQRYRRGMATDINLMIPEDHPLGLLKKRIPLNHNERVVKSTDINGYLTVHQNGSIELIRELNYELEKTVSCTVQIIRKGEYGYRSINLLRILVEVSKPTASSR
uniref:Cadherin domain-containing protein n=1 Tax=Syphacia muris TaxID=451379 RepID=A0A0N5ALU8_9BILA